MMGQPISHFGIRLKLIGIFPGMFCHTNRALSVDGSKMFQILWTFNFYHNLDSLTQTKKNVFVSMYWKQQPVTDGDVSLGPGLYCRCAKADGRVIQGSEKGGWICIPMIVNSENWYITPTRIAIYIYIYMYIFMYIFMYIYIYIYCLYNSTA